MEHSQLLDLVQDWVRARDPRPANGDTGISEDTDLIATAVLDSVGFIELLAYVEHQTGRPIDLNDVDPTQFTTVGGLCRVALNGA